MELGNFLFGNSRGEFEVNRDFQEWFVVFIKSLGFDFYGYGENYDEGKKAYINGSVLIRPYYWGECECDYDKEEELWSQENNHSLDCYRNKVKSDLLQSYGFVLDQYGCPRPPKKMCYDKEEEIRSGVRHKWCEHFGLSFPEGCAVHCTCDYQKRWEDFLIKHRHSHDCRIMMPNFENTETGLNLKWYKYPLRDSYSNIEIRDINHFQKLVGK